MRPTLNYQFLSLNGGDLTENAECQRRKVRSNYSQKSSWYGKYDKLVESNVYMEYIFPIIVIHFAIFWAGGITVILLHYPRHSTVSVSQT